MHATASPTPSTTRTRLAPLSLAIHLAVASVVSMGVAGQVHAQASAQAIQYDIPAGPLADALNRFAQQSGVAIVQDARRLQGLRTTGLKGSHGTDEGFAILLRNSGYVAVRTEGGYTVQAAPAATGDEAVLPAVKVRDRADTATQDSGSFTTGSTNTATGMALSLRETPQSVSVLTRQRLDDQKIGNLSDIALYTTGLSVNRYESNRGTMFSRGFNINTYLVDGVQSSTIVDERYSAGEVLTTTAIYDRVEVLRGSNGLMVGTGNPSAMINLVRKRADSDVFTGSVTAELGQWSHRGLAVDLNSPLTSSGHTRGRVVLDYDTRESHIDRLKNTTKIGFVTLEQDVGERTVLGLGISYQDNYTDDPTWGGVPMWTYDADNQPIRLELDRSLNPSTDWSYWKSDFTEAFASAEHRFSDNWKASARYTWSERDSAANMAMPYSSYPILPTTGAPGIIVVFAPGFPPYTLETGGWSGLYTAYNDKNSINLRLDGRFEFLDRVHDVAFGYDRSDERIRAYRVEVGSFNPGTIPDIRDNFQGDVADSRQASGVNDINQEIEQRALYAVGRFSLAKPLHLLAGARLIDYLAKDFHTPSRSIDSDNELVPYAGLVYDLPWGLSVYASYTSVFEPQPYRDADNALLDPIEGNTREAGIKGEFLNGRLNAMLAVFEMQQDNVAKSIGMVTDPDGTRRTAYESVDGVLSRGVELEVAGAITPDWQIQAGYSRFKAHDRLDNPVNTLIPRRQFNLFTSYRLPGAWNGLTIGGGVRWQSEVWAHELLAQVYSIPKAEQPSYFVTNLMARYEWRDGTWSAQLNIDNLLDEDYYAPTADGMQIFWGAPRGAELTVRYRF